MASTAALKGFLAAIRAEQAKRARLLGHDDPNIDARERLYAILEQMAARIRANPDYVEASPAEKKRRLAELKAYFAERSAAPGHGG